MQAQFVVEHSKYTGSTDSDGYPTGDAYDIPVQRKVFGWYPGQGSSGAASSSTGGGEYDRRVVTFKMLMVPDTSPYSVRDQVVLPGSEPLAERTFFVSQDVRDYTTGPFGYKPGGEVAIEKIVG